jgi:hypothetical protein
MSTVLFGLAILCLMMAIIGACNGKPGPAAAGMVGAVLFALLGVSSMGEDEHKRLHGPWDA